MTRSPKEKRKVRKRFIIESIGIFFIVVSPFIFKLHEYLPRNPEATIQFLGLIFDSNGFADLSTYAWFMLGKIVPLLLLIIWFLTCKHWWYHSILIPIMMYAFQIFEVFYSSDGFVDTRNILWLLPVCMVVIPIVYFIRIKLYDKYVHGIDLEAMEAEIKILRDKHGADKKKSSPSSVGTMKSDRSESKQYQKKSNPVSTQTPKEIGYKSLSEKIDEKLSTANIEAHFRQFQNQLGDWLDLKF